MGPIADRVISYQFRGSFTNLTAGLTAAGRGVREVASGLTTLDRSGERARRGLTSVSDSAGKIGLVAAAGLGLIIKSAADFDQAMSNIQAATHETADNMGLLREAALKAGADTAFSATEAAGAIEELAKAGVSTSDILNGGLSGALNLAAAGGIEVGEAAETAASALTQFKLAGTDVNHVADLLSAGAGKAQGSVSDLSAALNQSGLVAAQTGLSIEETTGALAAFASAGLIGSDAGTSFKTFLQSLTPSSKQAAKAMDAMGFSAYDAQGNFKGLTTVAGDLRAGLSTMTVEQQNATLKTIFGSDAVRAASIIYQQGADGIQRWIDKTDDSGYAAETAATRMDNLKGDLEALRGSLDTALIGSGSGAQGPLRSLTQDATRAVNSFNELPGPIKSATTGLIALTAVTGGAAFFGSRIITGIAATNTALAEMGSTARITAASLRTVATSAGVVAAAYYGIDMVSDAMDDMSRHADTATASMRGLQDVQQSITASNLGKYAADLGIDVDRLAQDLAENGRQGDYVAESMKKINDQTGTFSTIYDTLVPANEQLDRFGFSFGKNAEEANKAGIAFEALLSQYDKTHVALDGPLVGPGFNESLTGAGDGFAGLSAAMDQSAQLSEEAAKALEDARKAAHDVATSFFNLGDSLDDSKVSLNDWIADLEKQAQALQNFRQNARDAAENGLRKGLIQALEDAGPAGAMRMAQLANATESQIGRANKAWKRGQEQVNGYVNQVTRVPASKSTDISVNGVQPAISAVQALASLVNSLHDRAINIRVTKTTNATLGEAVANRAGGGVVYGPGTATSDSIPARLSNGEYVVKADSVAKYGVAMFDNLNAQRFATGGSVDTKSKGKRTSHGSYILPEDLDADGGLKAATRSIKHELAGLTRQVKRSEAAVDRQSDAFDASKDVVDRETSARDDLISKFDSLAASIQGQFQSDLFGSAGNPFGSNGPTNDPISVLMADIANSEQFGGLFAGLQGRGLTGGALQAGAAGGLTGLQTLSAYTDDQLRQFQSLFDKREQMGAAVGQQVAQAQYGQAISDQNLLLQQANTLNEQQAQLLAQTVAALSAVKSEQQQTTQASKAISSSAAKGARSKPRSRK